MRVKNWNFYYNKKEKKLDRIIEWVFLWIAIGLLWLSFFHMVKEKYPVFVEPFHGKELLEVLWKKAYFQEGVLSIVQVYIEDWNVYYGTSYMIADATGNYMSETFFVISVIWWIVVLCNVHLLRKRIFYALYPMSALILQFIVGRSPKESGMFYLFLGTLLLLFVEQKGQRHNLTRKKKEMDIGIKMVSFLFAMLLFTGSFFIAEVLFRVPIVKLKEKKSDILEWRQNSRIVSSIESLFSGWDILLSNENLNNHTPKYTGKVVLEITSDEKPESNLYLKGFYGTEYKNGTWNRTEDIFSQACEEAGYKKAEMIPLISNMPFQLMEKTHNQKKNQYGIRYKQSIGNTAYVPYLFDYKTLNKTYLFSGDYLLKKSFTDTSLSVTGFLNEDSSILIESLYQIEETDLPEWQKWYNRVAAEYTNVPANMEVLSEAVEELEENTTWVDLELEQYSISNGYGKELERAVYRNYKRQLWTYVVAEYLEERMSYCLVLDNLPYGTDPIVFALEESHQGYCMHFASAAVLMLRELGIPARYASGYVVRPSDFTWVEEENQYYAQIQDYHAHAWVEVYLNYIGWIPFEVTPGYDTEELLPTEQKRNEQKDDINSKPERETLQEDVTTPAESVSEKKLQEEKEREGLEKESEITGTQKNEIVSEKSEISGSSEGIKTWLSHRLTEWKDMFIKNQKWFVGCFICLFSFVVFFLLGKRCYIYYVQVLDNEIEKKQTRKAVARIQRRIYRYVWIYGLLQFGKNTKLQVGFYRKTLCDAEYGNLLAELFSAVSEEDWKQYIEILQKMQYSTNVITEIEMKHCQKCYKKVWQKR